MSEPPNKKGAVPEDKPSLESFLSSFEWFAAEVSKLAVDSAPEGSEQDLLVSTGGSLLGQTQRLTQFTIAKHALLSKNQQAEVAELLGVMNGEEFARETIATAQQIMARAPRGALLNKFLHWLGQNFKELKKIILELLHFIFDLLGISWPNWLDRLIQILDQFLDLLLTLLGDLFGLDFGQIAASLSQQEVNFTRELTAFEVLRNASRGFTPAIDET